MKFILATALLLITSSGCASAGTSSTFSRADAHCLSLAIYFEARGESQLGQLAVGSVVMNRVASPEFPNSVCGVVTQGGETPPCQFSWYCDGRSDRPQNAQAWQASNHLAHKILRGATDPTRGALYFHSTAVNPQWSLRRVGRVGAHIFYR